MTSNTIIVKPENLELVPHVFIKRYRRGGGVRMHKVTPSARGHASLENRPDIFVVAVPYTHTNHTSYTDITGNIAREITGTESSVPMYATANVYRSIYGSSVSFPSTANKDALEHNRDTHGTGVGLSVCAQSSQFEFNPSTQRCDLLVPGVCPMGPQADPHNYRIVLGGEMLGYAGSGFEGSRPSHY